MNSEEIFKQFINTLEDDIKNKTFLTYEEQEEWKDYLERIINSQTKKYKEVLDKIKEIINNKAFFDPAMPNCNALGQKATLEILELLEEINE